MVVPPEVGTPGEPLEIVTKGTVLPARLVELSGTRPVVVTKPEPLL